MKFLEVYKPDKFLAGRNFGLDLIRSVAILLVLISHLNISDQSTCGLKIGGLGVEIFFVLSGFLIGQILIRTFSKSLSLSSIMDFWIRRWFRTLPLYYLIIILKFILIDHSLGYKILVYFFFLQNNFVGIDFMPVTWSLVIEEWFYLTLPMIMLVFFHSGKVSPRALMIFILAFIFSISFLRTIFVLYMDRGFEGVSGNFPFRLDSLMCGVFIASLKLNYRVYYNWLASLKVFLSVFLCYACVLYWFGVANSVPGGINQALWTRTHWFLMNSLCVAFLIPYIETRVILTRERGFLKVIITSISVFSYCAYLIHMEVYRWVLKSPVFTGQWLIESFMVLFITFLFSAVVYCTYEKPMTDLRDRFKTKWSFSSAKL